MPDLSKNNSAGRHASRLRRSSGGPDTSRLGPTTSLKASTPVAVTPVSVGASFAEGAMPGFQKAIQSFMQGGAERDDLEHQQNLMNLKVQSREELDAALVEAAKDREGAREAAKYGDMSLMQTNPTISAPATFSAFQRHIAQQSAINDYGELQERIRSAGPAADYDELVESFIEEKTEGGKTLWAAEYATALSGKVNKDIYENQVAHKTKAAMDNAQLVTKNLRDTLSSPDAIFSIETIEDYKSDLFATMPGSTAERLQMVESMIDNEVMIAAASGNARALEVMKHKDDTGTSIYDRNAPAFEKLAKTMATNRTKALKDVATARVGAVEDIYQEMRFRGEVNADGLRSLYLTTKAISEEYGGEQLDSLQNKLLTEIEKLSEADALLDNIRAGGNGNVGMTKADHDKASLAVLNNFLKTSPGSPESIQYSRWIAQFGLGAKGQQVFENILRRGSAKDVSRALPALLGLLKQSEDGSLRGVLGDGLGLALGTLAVQEAQSGRDPFQALQKFREGYDGGNVDTFISRNVKQFDSRSETAEKFENRLTNEIIDELGMDLNHASPAMRSKIKSMLNLSAALMSGQEWNESAIRTQALEWLQDDLSSDLVVDGRAGGFFTGYRTTPTQNKVPPMVVDPATGASVPSRPVTDETMDRFRVALSRQTRTGRSGKAERTPLMAIEDMTGANVRAARQDELTAAGEGLGITVTRNGVEGAVTMQPGQIHNVPKSVAEQYEAFLGSMFEIISDEGEFLRVRVIEPKGDIDRKLLGRGFFMTYADGLWQLRWADIPDEDIEYEVPETPVEGSPAQTRIDRRKRARGRVGTPTAERLDEVEKQRRARGAEEADLEQRQQQMLEEDPFYGDTQAPPQGADEGFVDEIDRAIEGRTPAGAGPSLQDRQRLRRRRTSALTPSARQANNVALLNEAQRRGMVSPNAARAVANTNMLIPAADLLNAAVAATRDETGMIVDYESPVDSQFMIKTMNEVGAAEAYRPMIYDDYTGRTISSSAKATGNPTVGIGFNLNRKDAKAKLAEVGADYSKVMKGEEILSRKQATDLQRNVVREELAYLQKRLAGVEMPGYRWRALVSMSYNGRSLITKSLIKAIKLKNWERAAQIIETTEPKAKVPANIKAALMARRKIEANIFRGLLDVTTDDPDE